jgi:hypothetical protein
MTKYMFLSASSVLKQFNNKSFLNAINKNLKNLKIEILLKRL